MPEWAFWIIAAVVLSVGEIFSLSFYLAPFAGGAAVAALAAVLGAPLIVQGGLFLVASIVFLLVVRPIARAHRKVPPSLRTGTAALVGQTAVVVERIANDEAIGCVRIDGEVWTARAYDEEEVIPEGARVRVMEIRGATALVAE